jgi:hypothetical protein
MIDATGTDAQHPATSLAPGPAEPAPTAGDATGTDSRHPAPVLRTGEEPE